MTARAAGKRGRYNCPAVPSPTIDFMNLDDTIVAIATPPGRGGIGIVRLAGTAARTIIEPLLRLKHPLEVGRAAFGELIEPSECGAGDPARVTAGVPQYASESGISSL